MKDDGLDGADQAGMQTRDPPLEVLTKWVSFSPSNTLARLWSMASGRTKEEGWQARVVMLGLDPK
jgi:hypothetical protein